MPTVLVTGATGFIALHVVDQLLAQNYTVIGTVRSKDKGDRIVSQFLEEYPDAKLSYEIVGDIANPTAFDETVKKHPELDYVIHTASPVSFDVDGTTEEHHVTPAVNGTVGILKAVAAYAPNVKHVVSTSSFASIKNLDHLGDPSFIHTEETWNPITESDLGPEGLATPASVAGMQGYALGKKTAEAKARQFIKSEDVKFNFTTVNPPVVFGPQKFDSAVANEKLNFSAEEMNAVLKYPKDHAGPFDTPIWLTVDVRDVARAHIAPLKNSTKFAGKRLFPTVGRSNPQKVLDSMRKQFPELCDSLPEGDSELGKKTADTKSFFYDNAATKELLGEFVDYDKTIHDAVDQILRYRSSK